MGKILPAWVLYFYNKATLLKIKKVILSLKLIQYKIHTKAIYVQCYQNQTAKIMSARDKMNCEILGRIAQENIRIVLIYVMSN